MELKRYIVLEKQFAFVFTEYQRLWITSRLIWFDKARSPEVSLMGMIAETNQDPQQCQGSWMKWPNHTKCCSQDLAIFSIFLWDPKDTLFTDSRKVFGENNLYIPKNWRVWMVFGCLVGYGCLLYLG